jgi:hypothetical protein
MWQTRNEVAAVSASGVGVQKRKKTDDGVVYAPDTIAENNKLNNYYDSISSNPEVITINTYSPKFKLSSENVGTYTCSVMLSSGNDLWHFVSCLIWVLWSDRASLTKNQTPTIDFIELFTVIIDVSFLSKHLISTGCNALS